MFIKIGLENKVEGRSLVWVLDHPGCFAYGHDGHEALHNLPVALQDYVDWIILHGKQPWLQALNQDFEAEEVWEVYAIDENYDLYDDGYEINAWFLHDWKPLTGPEVERGLMLLSWSRADLLETVRNLSQPVLEARRPNERWSISGILNHVGGAEWWYLDRLGLAFPREQVPPDSGERLEVIRALLVETLPRLVGSKKVVGTDGEFWSPRKLLRRAIWHERDHTFHIRSLLDLM
jgi:hypothetical protein